jgi:hypothetical protein
VELVLVHLLSLLNLLQIFTTDPEGSFAAWNAVAVGADSANIMTQLAKATPLQRKINIESNQVASTSGVDSTVEAPEGSDVAAIWPKFKSTVLAKFFRNSKATQRCGDGSSSIRETIRPVSAALQDVLQDEESWVEDSEGSEDGETAVEWLVEVSDTTAGVLTVASVYSNCRPCQATM